MWHQISFILWLFKEILKAFVPKHKISKFQNSWIKEMLASLFVVSCMYLQLIDINFQSQRGTLTKVNISNLYPDRVFHFVDFSNNCIDEVINCDVNGPYPGCYSNWSITTFIGHQDRRRGGRLNLNLNECLKPFPDIAKLFYTERDPSLLSYMNIYR